MKNNTKNKMIHLNNHLFEQLERLNDDDLTDDQLKKEINRAKAMSSIASQIIHNAKNSIDAMKAIRDGLIKKPPEMLGLEGYDEEI